MPFHSALAAFRGSWRLASATSLCAIAALLLLPITASAGPDITDAPSHFSTVVTATRTPTPLEHLGSSVSVITAAEIEAHQWRGLPQILQTVPGLNLVQAGGPGAATTIFIRGANSNQTKVLIDGIVVNDPSQGGLFDFSQVSTADIQRVEVLRGPQSSLYGSDAIGGVINIITKKGEGPPRINARVEGGSFDTFNQSLGIDGASDRFNYAFNIAHSHTGASEVTPLGLLPAGRARNDDQYENTTASTRLGARLSNAVSLNLSARYTSSELGFTTDDYSVFPSVPAAEQTRQHDHNLFARAGVYFSLFDGDFENWAGIGYTRYRTRIQAPDTGFGTPAPTWHRGKRVKYNWQGNVKLAPGQTLVLGAEYHTDRLDNSPVTAENSDKAGFAEIQSRVVDNLFVTASARYDRNDRFGGKTTWRIAPSYTIAASGTQLKASYGTGFKAPTLTQLFVSYPAFNFHANPNLEPEASTGYDIGFEQPLLDDDLRFGVTWFHNDIENLIVTNLAGTSLANIGGATTHGVESFVSVTPTDDLSLKLDYTWTIAEDDATGKQLLRRPKNKANLTGTWQASNRLSLSTTLVYVGSWIDGNRSFTITRMKAHPYFVADIAVDYRINHAISVFARIDNLFDREYQNPIGFLHPGRGFFAGFQMNFGV